MANFSKTKTFKKPKNIFLLGSRDEHSILKEWAENDIRNRFHLNGWFHDKNIPASTDELIREYEEMAKNESVDHFVLDPSDMAPAMLKASINWAESQGSRIHLIQSGTTRLSNKLDNINRFGPFAAVLLRQEPLSLKRNQIFKKAFDVIMSSIVVFGILWWLYPLIGLLIKLTSKGPVIIRQNRIGIDGTQFKCMKFRTMVSDKSAEKGLSYLTSKDDSRITWIGKVLRKTNLDEFPQFLNVLMGDMSIIGPRPLPIKEDHEVRQKLKRYPLRQFIKPGVTGYAATNGYRGSTPDMELMQKRVDLDIWYIENWSFGLDLKICLITIWQMLTFSTGAR